MEYEWQGYKRVKEKMMLNEFDTGVSSPDLNDIATKITSLPSNYNFLRKIEKLIGDRKKMFF
jgi:2-oxoglutarate dehydrogenase E1 component